MLFERPKNAVVAGLSRLGARIAGILYDAGYHVTVIDTDEDAFRKLPEHFSGFQISGDATDIETLQRIGLQSASILVAVTEDDNRNSLIAQIARRIFNVPTICVRIDDPEKEKLICGLNVNVISPTRLSMEEFGNLLKANTKERATI